MKCQNLFFFLGKIRKIVSSAEIFSSMLNIKWSESTHSQVGFDLTYHICESYM